MVFKISPKAAERLDELHCSKSERYKIERCISRYSAPKTFSEGLAYVAHRIINAVKAVFGCSDWQLAVNPLLKGMKLETDFKKELFSALKESGIKNKSLIARINNRILPLLYDLKEIMPNMMLEALVRLNEGKDPKKIMDLYRPKMHALTAKLEKEAKFVEKKYGLNLPNFN